MNWNKTASKDRVERTIAALKKNNIEAFFAESGAAAKTKALALLPAGAEVMNMTSVTLDTVGLAEEILKSGKFAPVRPKLTDEKTSPRERKRLGAAPEWTIGSVHAVTENGEVLIASNTGSQLPAYAYGADHVIWIVGTQKIVKDKEAGLKRIYEHVLPLESERAKKAYGVPGSAVNKMLVVDKEVQPGRITMILVGEALGF